MKKGVPCDFFVLVIEGKVEITIGKEDKIFHEGPFSCFGEKMLEQEQLNFQNWSVNSVNNSERYCFLTNSGNAMGTAGAIAPPQKEEIILVGRAVTMETILFLKKASLLNRQTNTHQ